MVVHGRQELTLFVSSMQCLRIRMQEVRRGREERIVEMKLVVVVVVVLPCLIESVSPSEVTSFFVSSFQEHYCVEHQTARLLRFLCLIVFLLVMFFILLFSSGFCDVFFLFLISLCFVLFLLSCSCSISFSSSSYFLFSSCSSYYHY